MTVDGKSLSPTQRIDVAIKENIYEMLWKDDVLRALEYYEIDVYVKNAVVHLSGHIVSATSQNRIENAIRNVPGILEIKNNLILDEKLTLEVALSLGALEHTYDCKFFTGASHGVISLNGIVNDENVKLLAEQCVASNLNVRGVVNNVRVSGSEQGLHNRVFLQPTIGAIIYFLDGIFGVVKQVVINPDNRCVIHVIIQGQFSSQKQDLRSLTIHPAHMLEKSVVIPVNLIRYLTNSSGFLTIKSPEITRYKDFNPLYFIAPQSDWVPPYPYCPQDVLFTVNVEGLENQIMVDPDIEQINASAQPTSPNGPETPVDIVAAWEDDGGQIIQTAELESIT
jgi:osmotically-inducible protein OsmY